jgi:hypothetical protein
MPSSITRAPFPPVIAFTRAAKFSRVETMAWSQPCARASAAFPSEPAVPMTGQPRCFAHRQSSRPTPRQ